MVSTNPGQYLLLACLIAVAPCTARLFFDASTTNLMVPASSFDPADELLSFESVLSSIESLAVRSTCFSEASRELLQECHLLSSGLADEQRSRFAIALTLCELSSAGVTGPKQCQRLGQYKEVELCARNLEKKPQW